MKYPVGKNLTDSDFTNNGMAWAPYDFTYHNYLDMQKKVIFLMVMVMK